MIPIVLAVLTINFALIHLAPGDPALIIAGEQATWEFVEQVRHMYGLDQPLHVQYAIYLSSTLRGDLGYSIKFGRPVLSVIAERIPATLLLVLTSQLIGLVIGVVFGVYSARRYGTKVDALISFTSLALYSMPIFWFGLVLMIIFGMTFHILPTSGMISPGLSPGMGFEYIADLLRHLILPSFTLTMVWVWPQYLRLTRASMLEVMGEDFVTAARAKGLNEKSVFYGHILRNSLLPVVTMAGIYLGLALTGAILTETVFAWPGLGRFMIEGIWYRDYPLVMGIFFIVSISVVVASFLTDIVYAILDPRITYR
jgi:peptide/nickel transport system permease protein